MFILNNSGKDLTVFSALGLEWRVIAVPAASVELSCIDVHGDMIPLVKQIFVIVFIF